MIHAIYRSALLIALVPALAACDTPNPADYGGGEKGEIIAKCVSRTERADNAVTREQAGEMCTCFADKTMNALTGGGMNRSTVERALLSCAKKAGIEVTG